MFVAGAMSLENPDADGGGGARCFSNSVAASSICSDVLFLTAP